MNPKKLLFLVVCFSTQMMLAQSTYQQIYSIFQAKCSGCHNSSTNSGLLNLTAAPSAVYAALVNHAPVNPAAVSKGFKRITPGYPHRSFLLRKVNNSLDPDNNITNAEGGIMPSPPNPSLTNYEIELIRQWVLHGAPETGTVVDTALINTFYATGGINSVPVPLTPPSPSAGFQVHLGKIFLAPSTETEIFIKYDLKLADTLEINRIELSQSPQSHHFVIYKYFEGQAVNFPEGLRDTTMNGHGSTNILTAFSPQTTDHVLPTGTAYLIPQNEIWDLNYHLVNSSPDSILAAEIYFNVYTQPKGTAQKYMYSKFFPNFSIVIPANDSASFTSIAADTAETNMWDIWILYTHTHRFGVDYDVWKRNPDGSEGQQVYEGFYNFEYTFDQGYYAWGVEAPQRHFDPFLEINPKDGLLHKASYYNYTNAPVYFGMTSQDEMMVMGFQYTEGASLDPSAIKENKADGISFKVYPNPFSGEAKVSYALKGAADVKVEVYNMLGEIVETLFDAQQTKGIHTHTLRTQLPGIYFLNVTVNGKTYSHKMIKTNE
ncbi:MAG: T9SS type A sorting domain-containing protein [Bacteroidia bacterium]